MPKLRRLDHQGLLSTFSVEGGSVVRRVEQPARRSILERNQELRLNPEALRHLDWSGMEVTIPAADLYELWKLYPALNSTDVHEKSAMIDELLRKGVLGKYRLREAPRPRKRYLIE